MDDELKKFEEEANKKLLSYEWVIGYIALASFLVIMFLVAFVIEDEYLQLGIGITAFVIFMIACAYAVKIETEAGYYECGNCKNRYVPKYKDVFLAMHVGRTRYLKCPECNKRSWNKKVLTK
ncbi:MAG: hypothetical protein IJS47_06320 [Clostridia bacterium]|nr:hypothetical protein [Clostridia bacterium]